MIRMSYVLVYQINQEIAIGNLPLLSEFSRPIFTEILKRNFSLGAHSSDKYFPSGNSPSTHALDAYPLHPWAPPNTGCNARLTV